MKKFIVNLNENKYTPKNLGEFIYHQTNYKNAIAILKEGFKAGSEVNKGEKNNGIFFAATDRGQENVTYNRGDNNRTVMVEVSTHNLNLFDTSELEEDPNLQSFQQKWYRIVRDVKEKNLFPEGYDGILSRSMHNGGIFEIILKPEIANRNLTGKIKNLRRQYIQL